MAKKKVEKRLRRLKQRAEEAELANRRLAKRVRKIQEKLNARKQQIADLEDMLGRSAPITEVKGSPTAQLGHLDATNIASSHRSAWKQHSYLRDRYEFHLGAGEEKAHARLLANEDLKREYGKAYGYTEEELGAILS